MPGNGPESGCHCHHYEGACTLDFLDATWSYQCFECKEDAAQHDVKGVAYDQGVGVAVAVSTSVTVVVICACLGFHCFTTTMIKLKPVSEPYIGPPITQSAGDVVGTAVPGQLIAQMAKLTSRQSQGPKFLRFSFFPHRAIAAADVPVRHLRREPKLLATRLGPRKKAGLHDTW